MMKYLIMARDYKKECLNSKFGFKIMKEIRYGNNSPSKISKNMDTSINSISNYLRGFRKLGFVESRKDGRKKIYSINYEGIIDYFFEIIGEEPEGENNKKSWELLEGYIKDYLRVMEDKTIKQMLFIDFTTGLIKTMEKLDDSDKPVLDYLKDLWDLVNRKAVPQETPQGIVEDNLF